MGFFSPSGSGGGVISQSSEPASTSAGVLWNDTDSDILYRRNDADTAWLEVPLIGGGTSQGLGGLISNGLGFSVGNIMQILTAYPDPTTIPTFYLEALSDLLIAVPTATGMPYKWTGVSSELVQGVIDDFSNYVNDAAFDVEWVTSDAAKIDPDATTETIDIIGASGANNVKCFHDMGHGLSNEKFLIKGQFTIGTIAANNTSFAASGIMVRSTNTAPGSAGDLIFLNVNYRSDKTVFGIYGVNSGHGQNIGHEFTTIFPVSDTTYYFTLERKGISTVFTATFYTDNTYSVEIESQDEAVTGAMLDYRYFGAYNYSVGGSTNTMDMKIDKLECGNGVNV